MTNHRPAGNSPYDLRYVAVVLALGAAHFIVAKLGLALSVGRPTLLWLASGVDLAALLTLGYRYWPGVALGALVEALTAGAVPGFALGAGAAAAGGGLTGAVVLQQVVKFRREMNRVRDVLALVIIGAFGSTLVSTFMGISSRCVAAGFVCGRYWSNGWVWWLGEAMGVVVIAPLVLVWSSRPGLPGARRIFEASLLAMCLMGEGWLAFGDMGGMGFDDLPIAYLSFPLLMWAALRFGQRGATLATFVTVITAAWGTARGHGPFHSHAITSVPLMWVWVYSFVASVTALLSAALVAERETAIRDSVMQRDIAAQVMNAMGQGVTVLDQSGRFEFVNFSYAELVGRDAAALEGARPEDFAVWEDRTVFRVPVEERQTAEVRFLRSDGSVVPTLVTRAPRRREGEVIGAITVITDLTETKQAQTALLESEARFRSMFERHQAAMLLIDGESGRVVDANPAAEAFYGYHRDDLCHKGLAELAELPAGHVQDTLDRIKAGGSAYAVLPHRLANGEVRHVEMYSSVVAYRDREQLFAIVHDVTKRVEAMDALRESEERYRELVELSPVPIVVHANLSILYANAEAVELFGAPGPRDMIGRQLFDFVHPDSRPAYLRRRDTLARGEEPGASEFLKVVRFDGEPREIEISSSPIQFFGASARQIVIRDVTERRRAEAALRESEAQLRTLVEYAPDAIVVYDVTAGRFIDANENALRMFGYTLDELRHRSPADVSPPYQPDGKRSDEAAAGWLQQAVDGANPIFAWTHRRSDGTDVPCEIHLVRLPASSRVLVRGSMRDVTERRRLEDQLRQSQKMEAVGRLAGGIAHDFNNLTTAILGYGDLSLELIAQDDPLRVNIEEIRKAAIRAADLTRQLLAFARKHVVEPKVIVLNDLVLRMEEMLSRLIGEDIQLETDPDPDLAPVKVDPGQFEQVLMNLAVNARDAMPKGGKLTISTRNAVLDAAFQKRHPEAIPGKYVLVNVTDTGVGMSDDVAARAFEPFFTTKERGKGTGLGLATCYGVVKQAGGYIYIETKPGSGTSFDIYLPPAEGHPVVVASGESSAGSRVPGTETILLVEDEGMVMDMVERILEVHGYTVLTAADGEEALFVAENHPTAIDLLLTDVVMPKMSGGELARKLTRRQPDLKVLFMSGYAEDVIAHQGELDQGTAFLQKPFGPQILTQTVRKVLDQPVGERAS